MHPRPLSYSDALHALHNAIVEMAGDDLPPGADELHEYAVLHGDEIDRDFPAPDRLPEISAFPDPDTMPNDMAAGIARAASWFIDNAPTARLQESGHGLGLIAKFLSGPVFGISGFQHRMVA